MGLERHSHVESHQQWCESNRQKYLNRDETKNRWTCQEERHAQCIQIASPLRGTKMILDVGRLGLLNLLELADLLFANSISFVVAFHVSHLVGALSEGNTRTTRANRYHH